MPMRRAVSMLFALTLVAAPLLRAQREWLDSLPPDAEVPAEVAAGIAALLQPVPLPGAGDLRGMAGCGKDLWLARGDRLRRFDPDDGKTLGEHALPTGLLGLAGDARFLYVLRRQAVDVYDPDAVVAVRELTLPERDRDPAPCAIADCGDELCIAWPGRRVLLDKHSGAVRELPPAEATLLWMAGTGRELWGGTHRTCMRLTTTAEPQQLPSPRRLPIAAQRGAGAFVGERLLLAFDYKDAQGSAAVAAGWLLPGAGPLADEVDLLSLKIYHDQRGVQFVLGPRPLRSIADLRKELHRIAAEPAAMVPGPDGKQALMQVALEANPGVLVKELAAVWDEVTAAGFARVACAAAGQGDEVVAPPPPPPPPEPSPERGR